MSPDAISLVERLPYPNKSLSRDRWRFFFEAIAANYLNEDELRDVRDPHLMWRYTRNDMEDFEPDVNYLLPHDVALTLPFNYQDCCWVLDIKANAIRTLSGLAELPAKGDWSPSDFEWERPDDLNHYRNWPAYHAPFVLSTYVQDLWNLKIVPSGLFINHDTPGNDART
ncbi:hypothetical protein ACRALDRAFT_1061525 [Sodiomyces alcalophilus JCM 7366]|uniref:uncharacterized protein n=1 Tax=Sodiomyces alcalophilus JCM 7366 TaxID=591952 RepID=UPI0039B4FFA2